MTSISGRPNVGDLVESVESLESFTGQHGHGRYGVNVHSLDPFPGSKTWLGRGATRFTARMVAS
jgi:hypothetical protein